MTKRNGYTLLELLVVLGVVTLIIAVVVPDFGNTLKKRAFHNSYTKLTEHISSMRSEALTRSTTSRIRLQQVSGAYILTAYVTSSPVANCNVGNPWVQLYSLDIEVPSEMQVTGSGVGDVCFYRDGSTTGGQYNYTDGGAGIGSATITLTIATGYLDVVATN